MCLGTILCYIIKDHFFNATFIKGECNNPKGFLLSKILLELLFCYSREMAIILMFFQQLRVAFTKKNREMCDIVNCLYSQFNCPSLFQLSSPQSIPVQSKSLTIQKSKVGIGLGQTL